MKRYNATNLFLLTFLIISAFTIQSCKDNSTSAPEPDFSSVPAPFDTTSALERDARDNGLVVYTIEEGNNIFKVSQRDWIAVFYTGRTTDGEIFTSSYVNGSTSPTGFYNLTDNTSTGPGGSAIQPIPAGLREGVLNMSPGERRTLVVPPSLGYSTIPITGQLGLTLRNDTLVYDVELVEILY